jgi:hypothetical protein
MLHTVRRRAASTTRPRHPHSHEVEMLTSTMKVTTADTELRVNNALAQ